MNIKIAPSLLAADFSNLASEIKRVSNLGVGFLHIDIMDGHFVPNISIGPAVVRDLRPITDLPFEAHLMIQEPLKYVDRFLEAGADIITLHIETISASDFKFQAQRLHKKGKKIAIALNPKTPVEAIRGLLGMCDMVLVMTVNPGFGGQKFIPFCKDKIVELKKIITQKKLKTLIEVDGGVKVDNIAELSKLGADVFVSGSAIFGSKSYKETIVSMKKAIA